MLNTYVFCVGINILYMCRFIYRDMEVNHKPKFDTWRCYIIDANQTLIIIIDNNLNNDTNDLKEFYSII